MEISAEAARETPSHMSVKASADATLEIVEKPIPEIETGSPIPNSDSNADPNEPGDSAKTPAEFLTSEEPLPDVTPPKLAADPIADNDITDNNNTAPKPA